MLNTKVCRGTYKPFIPKSPGLLLAFMAALSLIALLEYAARTLPVVVNKVQMPATSKIDTPLHRRQTDTTVTSARTTRDAYLVPASTLTTVRTTSARSSERTSSITSPNAYLPTASRVFVTTIVGTDSSGKIKTSLSTYTTREKSTQLTATPAQGSYLKTTSRALVKSSLSTCTITPTPYLSTHISTSTITTTNLSGQVGTTISRHPIVETILPNNGEIVIGTVLIAWPLWWVFASGYLPLLLAILVKMFWSSIYANVKILEPFTQLSEPGGALAKDSFYMHYLSSSLIPDPFFALPQRRWLIFWTSLVYLVTGILGPSASEVLFLDTYYCGEDECFPPKLSANGPILRVLQGLLSFIAIMTLSIMVMLHRSTTGINSNPTSIASIATLLHHPEVLDDFRQLDDDVTTKEMANQLGNKRYQLGSYQTGQDDVWRYGIIPADHSSTPGWSLVPLDQVTKPGPTVTASPMRKKTHRVSLAMDASFILFIVGLLVVIVVYFKDGSNSGFNIFFNSNSFGPRFFMSFMGTIIAMYWKRINRSVQTLTPFRRMIQSPSPAASTILFRHHTFPPLVIVNCLITHHFFAALVASTTLLADILTITLSVIPYSPNEIYIELLGCAYTSMAILGLMILVLIGLVFWKRKLREMPRRADTVGGVASYICGSRMLEELEGCEGLNGRELAGRFGKGNRFGSGRLVGVDGRRRWGVDEVGVAT